MDGLHLKQFNVSAHPSPAQELGQPVLGYNHTAFKQQLVLTDGCESDEDAGLLGVASAADDPSTQARNAPPVASTSKLAQDDEPSMLEFNAVRFAETGNPGGDCRRLCVRHQRMMDAGQANQMQKVRLHSFPMHESSF